MTRKQYLKQYHKTHPQKEGKGLCRVCGGPARTKRSFYCKDHPRDVRKTRILELLTEPMTAGEISEVTGIDRYTVVYSCWRFRKEKLLKMIGRLPSTRGTYGEAIYAPLEYQRTAGNPGSGRLADYFFDDYA